MENKDTFTITISLRNGFTCEHKHYREPKKELLRFLSKVLDGFTTGSKSILTLPNPYGIYHMEDVSGIVFHLESDEGTPRIGFHTAKSEGNQP